MLRTRGGLRGLVATVTTSGCLFAGLVLVTGSLAAPHPVAVMPPLSVGTETARVTEAGDAWSRNPPAARSPHDHAVPTAQHTLAPSVPVRLAIPSIGVASDLQHLGLDAAGGLEVPRGTHYDEAAWYRYSPTPGELGPAVLLGHIDSAANGPSVFFRLGAIGVGEQISVTRADASTAVFTVDAVHRYPKDDFPTELVYGDIDHAGLRIITCGGAFDRTARSYVDNIVVFASLDYGSSPMPSSEQR